MKSYNLENETNLDYKSRFNLVNKSKTENYSLYVPHYSAESEEYKNCIGYWLISDSDSIMWFIHMQRYGEFYLSVYNILFFWSSSYNSITKKYTSVKSKWNSNCETIIKNIY